MKTKENTPAQQAAIETDAPCVLVVAGPGSGKTHTLVSRIRHLLEKGVKPEEIVVLTFTNAAAREIEHRLGNKQHVNGDESVPTQDLELGHVGTLHSFCLRMLKEHGESMGYGERIALISPESAADLLESKAKTVGCKASMKDLMKLKGQGRPPRSAKMDLPRIVVASYYDDLKTAGVVDYDILLSEMRDALTDSASLVDIEIEARFDHLLVDEVQDSSPIDWAIYDALPIQHKFYVGDPDQAIYSFRGGSVAGIVALAASAYTKVIELEDNFRSCSEICDTAQKLIEENVVRVQKVTRSVSGPGGKIFVAPACGNEGEEIGCVVRTIQSMMAEDPGQTFAVLARTNFMSSAYVRVLEAYGIPVIKRTVTELPRDWGMARAFIELLSAPDNDALAFFYLIALSEKKGAGPKEARGMAHAVRKAASAAGKSVNQASLGFGLVTKPHVAMQALQSQNISLESRVIAAEKLREMPPGCSVLDFALAMAEVRDFVKEDKDQEGVHCLTIHGAKGREWDTVFLTGFEDEVIPGRRSDVDVEEERRLAYVAMTRARRNLYLSYALSRTTSWGEIVKHTPTRFLKGVRS